MFRKVVCMVASSMVILAVQGTVYGAVLSVSTFDTGLDGWTLIGSGKLSHRTTGGNPGGFARFDDESGTAGDGWISAPAAFLGDWSSLDGVGTLSWDHIILDPGGGPTILRGAAYFSGPAGSASFQSNQYFTTSWQTFSAPIDRSRWTVTGSWPNLLANVTFLRIRIEAAHNAGPTLDKTGIDSVSLIPEPSCFTLVTLAGTGLLLRRRRRQ